MEDAEANEMLMNALVKYLDESLSWENSIREILVKSGHDDPNLPLEDCVSALVMDYLRLIAS